MGRITPILVTLSAIPLRSRSQRGYWCQKLVLLRATILLNFLIKNSFASVWNLSVSDIDVDIDVSQETTFLDKRNSCVVTISFRHKKTFLNVEKFISPLPPPRLACFEIVNSPQKVNSPLKLATSCDVPSTNDCLLGTYPQMKINSTKNCFVFCLRMRPHE